MLDQEQKLCTLALILVGMELIFFIAANLGLFWICAENSADSTPMFPLLLSRAHTASRPFLLLSPPHPEQTRGAQGFGRGHSWDSRPQLTLGVF